MSLRYSADRLPGNLNTVIFSDAAGLQLRFLFIVFTLLLSTGFFTGCAPKVQPPPRYIQEELSLDEIMSHVDKDIQTLKAVADVRIERNSELVDQVASSVLVQRPGRAHMRIYKFGMLVRDIVMQDRTIYGLKSRNGSKFPGLIDEFFHAVFWWDNLEDPSLFTGENEYIIRTVNKEIRLDRATLLPVRQDINSSGKTVHVTYAEPQNYEGLWYPSRLEISVDDFRFSVTIDRLIKNPLLEEADFRIPAGG